MRRLLIFIVAWAGVSFTAQMGFFVWPGIDRAAAQEEKTKTALPEYALGEADAPLTITEYASLTCPACRNFHTNVLPQLKTNYIDTGKVRLVYKPFILNPLDAAAHMLSYCAGDDRFFALVDTFFEQQSTWTGTDKPLAAMLQISKQAGFTDGSFETCLKDQSLLDRLNAVRDDASQRFDVQSTPTFVIGDETVVGVEDYKTFEERLKKRLP